MTLRRCQVAGCGCTRQVGPGTLPCAPCDGTGKIRGGVCGACHGTAYAASDAPGYTPAALSPAQQVLADALLRTAEDVWSLPRGAIVEGGRTVPLPDLRAAVATVLRDMGWTVQQIARVLLVRRSAVLEYWRPDVQARLNSDRDLRETVQELRIIASSARRLRRVS